MSDIIAPSTQASNELLPGALIGLSNDEKILVLFAVAFSFVLIATCIAGLICVLSGTTNKSTTSCPHHPERYFNSRDSGIYEGGLPDAYYNTLPLSYTGLSLHTRPDHPPSLRAHSDSPYDRPRPKLRRLSLSQAMSDSASVTSYQTSQVYSKRAYKQAKKLRRVQRNASSSIADISAFNRGFVTDLPSYPRYSSNQSLELYYPATAESSQSPTRNGDDAERHPTAIDF